MALLSTIRFLKQKDACMLLLGSVTCLKLRCPNMQRVHSDRDTILESPSHTCDLRNYAAARDLRNYAAALPPPPPPPRTATSTEHLLSYMPTLKLDRTYSTFSNRNYTTEI